jgi:hypothetical protein
MHKFGRLLLKLLLTVLLSTLVRQFAHRSSMRDLPGKAASFLKGNRVEMKRNRFRD